MESLVSDNDYEVHLGGTAKPGIQKTLDCRRDLRHLCGRPRQCSELWLGFAQEEQNLT